MERYKILERALVEIEKGWCRIWREDSQGNVCAVGALERAVYGKVDYADIDPYELPATLGLTQLVKAKRFRFVSPDFPELTLDGIDDVNDRLGRDAVVALFQEAIRNEKAKAGIPVDLPEPVAEAVPA